MYFNNFQNKKSLAAFTEAQSNKLWPESGNGCDEGLKRRHIYLNASYDLTLTFTIFFPISILMPD